MKILMIGQKRFPDSREGGIDVVVQNLALELVKLGHEVTVLVRRKKGYNPPKEYQGVKIKKIFTINSRRLDAIIYSFFATKYVKKAKVDVAHFHALGNTLFLRKLRNINDKKVVVTIHGLDWKRGKFKGLGNKILMKSERAVVKYAHEIITLCDNDKNYFKTKYSKDTLLIPNGVAVPQFFEPSIIKDKYGLSKTSYILFLSRIVEEKGVHFLIEAYNKISNPHLKLVIAGGSSHSIDYFNAVKNLANNNKNIIFTDFVKGKELHELFSNAAFYVLPSTIEGMPISLIEALSHKNVCLCSDIKELKDMKSSNIYYFQNKNVEDLKDKITWLMNEKKKYIDEQIFLSWTEVAKLTVDVYEKRN